MDKRIRRYSELIAIPTFEERFRYLKLDGSVGVSTFGFDRYLNQAFYRSVEWKRLRDQIIIRDNGCDLACYERQIFGRVIIHHLNPISEKDINDRAEWILNPEFLICTTIDTHNAIHYSDESILRKDPIVRLPNDTMPWRN